MTKKQIYLDMDGVLADFDKKKHEVFDKDAFQDQDNNQEMWKYIHKNYPDWFLQLEMMPDAELLWDFCKKHKPILLTALSRANIYTTVEQKLAWAQKHLHPTPPVIVCMRTHKKDYANTDAILVDDHEDNIKSFTRKGGVGILHKTAALSIAQLIDLV